MYIKNIIDFLFPRVCLVCRNKITISAKDQNFVSNYYCYSCLTSMPMAATPDELLSRLIEFFPHDKLAISEAASLFSSNDEHPFTNIIYKLKYAGFTKVAEELGLLLGKLLEDYNMIDYHYIVPVPIHVARRRERGYNQSEFIAKGVSKQIGINVQNKLLKRTKYTTTQTMLSATKRRENVKNVFYKNPKFDITNKNILLIDDVLTTGSTLNACAEVLLENKARKVGIATLRSEASRL